MSTIKLYFNSPLPNNQQRVFLKNLKELGFSAERIFQDGEYIKWRYFGRLPTGLNDNVAIQFTDDKAKSDLRCHKIDYVEFILNFERKEKS